MTQGRRFTFRVSVIGEDEVKKKRTVQCEVKGGVDFVIVNGRRLNQETVEMDDELVAVFTVEPRGHGSLTTVFSLVDEDAPSLEYKYLVVEEPEYRPPIWVAAPSRHGRH
ncbi:MAG: hypothetical protein V1716_00385 [Candidatus Uhrbacteria bacterium]